MPTHPGGKHGEALLPWPHELAIATHYTAPFSLTGQRHAFRTPTPYHTIMLHSHFLTNETYTIPLRKLINR